MFRKFLKVIGIGVLGAVIALGALACLLYPCFLNQWAASFIAV